MVIAIATSAAIARGQRKNRALTILYTKVRAKRVRIASYQMDNSDINLTGAILMKRNFVFAAIFSLCVFTIAVSAQKAPNYSGTWTLDVSKSKLGERNSIESQTLTVTQTEKDIKVAAATKRMAPPAGGGGGGGRMGGGMGGGDGTNTYTLDGKETTIETETPMGKVPTKLTGKWDGAKLSLASSTTFTTPNGEMTRTNKETWSLSADGNTLTIEGEMSGRNGAVTTTKVFTKGK